MVYVRINVGGLYARLSTDPPWQDQGSPASASGTRIAACALANSCHIPFLLLQSLTSSIPSVLISCSIFFSI